MRNNYSAVSNSVSALSFLRFYFIDGDSDLVNVFIILSRPHASHSTPPK
jgi:hypothetical protein